MDSLIDSCERFQDYPKNLVRPEVLNRCLKSYYDRLNSEQHKLFFDQISNASHQLGYDNAVDFIDFNVDEGEDMNLEMRFYTY